MVTGFFETKHPAGLNWPPGNPEAGPQGKSGTLSKKSQIPMIPHHSKLPYNILVASSGNV